MLITTDDGSFTLFEPILGEAYHSNSGALYEARTLYIKNSGIEQRFSQAKLDTKVLDVGLGLGYNAFATLEAWSLSCQPGDLTLVSLEHNKDLVSDLLSCSAAWQVSWPDLWKDLLKSFRAVDPLTMQLAHKSGAVATWSIDLGDAVKSRFKGVGSFDFVWQDPFSPSKNPKMWDAQWFSYLREHCSSETTLATYSCSRVVKDALTKAHWSWKKIKTTGGKKHWLMAKPSTI